MFWYLRGLIGGFYPSIRKARQSESQSFDSLIEAAGVSGTHQSLHLRGRGIRGTNLVSCEIVLLRMAFPPSINKTSWRIVP